MFEALVITLREGVEAALVLAIAGSIITRRGLAHLRGALFAGAATALAASIPVAMFATRLTYNQELAEGIAMMLGAALVLTLVWWMWKAAPHMRRDIEAGVERHGGSVAGMFLFAFVMVFREGVETAIFLSAAGFNTQGLGLWLGAAVGLVLAIVFGVLFARGSLRVAIKPFFSLTSALLLLIAIQLLVGGLHELSEAEVLPSSKAEMALIGPFVKNELLLFTLTVALAAAWLLLGVGRAPQSEAAPAASGPEVRLVRAARARETALRRWTGIIGLMVVGFLSVAFVRQSQVPGRAPAQPLTVESDRVRLDSAPLEDGHLHFYEASLPEGAVRFFAIRVGSEIRTCFDACTICGDKGYFEDAGSVVCRNCTAPIVLSSLGRSGGCNPIPLPHRLSGGTLEVSASDLNAARPHLKGR